MSQENATEPLDVRKLNIMESTYDWRNNACLNPYRNDEYLYIAGFRMAAELLVEAVTKNHREQDFLIFPIMYDYRHYLELSLKSLITTGCRLLNQPAPNLHGHDLAVLWRKCRPIMTQVFKKEATEQLDQINHVIEQFQLLDGRGTAFRYNRDAWGNPSLEGVNRIGIDTVGIMMKEISVKFDWAIDTMAEMLSWKSEMESYYGGC